jgi:hypothetical protein
MCQKELRYELKTSKPLSVPRELNKGQNGAFADIQVKIGLIKLLQKRFDVCEEA